MAKLNIKNAPILSDESVFNSLFIRVQNAANRSITNALKKVGKNIVANAKSNLKRQRNAKGISFNRIASGDLYNSIKFEIKKIGTPRSPRRGVQLDVGSFELPESENDDGSMFRYENTIEHGFRAEKGPVVQRIKLMKWIGDKQIQPYQSLGLKKMKNSDSKRRARRKSGAELDNMRFKRLIEAIRFNIIQQKFKTLKPYGDMYLQRAILKEKLDQEFTDRIYDLVNGMVKNVILRYGTGK